MQRFRNNGEKLRKKLVQIVTYVAETECAFIKQQQAEGYINKDRRSYRWHIPRSSGPDGNGRDIAAVVDTALSRASSKRKGSAMCWESG